LDERKQERLLSREGLKEEKISYTFYPGTVRVPAASVPHVKNSSQHSLQDKILSRVKQLPAARVYVDKFQSGKILTNDELLKAIELYAKEETRAQIEFNSIVLETDPPGHWKAIKCKICNEPLLGVLVYPVYENGRLIQDYCKGLTHPECRP
jgi:hypothetical protein